MHGHMGSEKPMQTKDGRPVSSIYQTHRRRTPAAGCSRCRRPCCQPALLHPARMPALTLHRPAAATPAHLHIRHVAGRHQHAGHARRLRRQQLLLDASHGQHQAPQGELACRVDRRAVSRQWVGSNRGPPLDSQV